MTAIVLSAIATSFSILALFKEIFIPLIFKPRVFTECGKEGEYLSTLQQNGSYFGAIDTYYFYRLKFTNSRSIYSSRGDGLYTKILSIKKDGEELQPFNPMTMRWVSAKFSEDLSRGEHMFVNLCTVLYEGDDIHPVKDYRVFPGHMSGRPLALAAGFPEDKLKDGKYEYEIGLYGKRIEGKLYKITIDFENDKGKPKMEISCCSQSINGDKGQESELQPCK